MDALVYCCCAHCEDVAGGWDIRYMAWVPSIGTTNFRFDEEEYKQQMSSTLIRFSAGEEECAEMFKIWCVGGMVWPKHLLD